MADQRKNSDLPDKDTLRKYLQGKLSPDEAHRLEKLILNNPFYQDALDGMEFIGEEDLEQDLKDLSSQIGKRTQLHKDRGSFKFYRIAAAIILLAAFSYVIVYTTSRMYQVSKNETLSQKQDAIDEEQQVPDAAPALEEEDLDKSTDSDDIQARQLDNGMAMENRDRPEQNKNEPTTAQLNETTEEIISNVQKRTDEVVSDSEFIVREPSETEEESFDMTKATKQKVEYTLPKEEDSYDLKAGQEQDVILEDEKAELAVVEEENLDIQSNQLKIPTEEHIAAREKSMSEAAPATKDIIQTSESKRRENKLARQSESQSEEAAKAAAAPSLLGETETEEILKPVPVNGYEDYSYYIEENLMYPEKAKKDEIEGMVKLSFTIDKDSIPGKVRVLQSLSPDCDREAIRLLEAGPKWIPVYRNGELIELEVEYTISFHLNE